MMQVFLGAILGILVFGVVAFLLAALLAVRRLADATAALRDDLGKAVVIFSDVITVLKPLKDTLEDSIAEFADRMADSTKELRGVVRINSSLNAHAEQCKELESVGKEFVKQARGLLAITSALYAVLVRPGAPAPQDISFPAVPPPDVAPPQPRTSGEPPPPPPVGAVKGTQVEASFYPFSEEEAAEREQEKIAKDLGVPIVEEPEHPVPKEQMNDGGNV